MGRGIEVPITPAVLAWAIRESGYTEEQFAGEAGVTSDDLTAWLAGEVRPSLTAARALAQALRRPLAALLLPKPPQQDFPRVEFRHLPGAADRALSPEERRHIRRVHRIQKMLAWLAGEMKEPPVELVGATLAEDAENTADLWRALLDIDITTQRGWSSPSKAFDAWRTAVERVGIAVFLVQLKEQDCRGFSIADEVAPVIAVSTAWNDAARIFTMFHELGHLVTKTSSACAMAPAAANLGHGDPAERWCERFAAALLVPGNALRELAGRSFREGRVDSLRDAGRLATEFRVSLRAMTLRLIELGLASWDLYREITPAGDRKEGGWAKGGRDRQERQEDQLGELIVGRFRRAVDREVIPRAQALTYLDVSDDALDSMGRSIS